VVGATDATAIVGRAPDVVVLGDVGRADDVDAGALAASLGRALPASRLLVAVHDDAVGDPHALIDGWVGGVVHLDAEGAMSLVEAIECLALGEGLLDATLARAVLERHRQTSGVAPLTPTEEEVLARLADGASAETLAGEYAVSPRLVRLHAGGALARLHPVA
jgi:DNA-binding NarL/FixJ family response regulator